MKPASKHYFNRGLGLGLMAGMTMTIGASMLYLATSRGGEVVSSGEPPYIGSLRASGLPITELNDKRLTEQGLRGWEIQRAADRIFAYAPIDAQSVILGGTLYGADQSVLGKDVEVAHQRQQLTLNEFAEEATWISLDSDGKLSPAQAYLLIDPATADAQQAYADLITTGHDLSTLRAAPYPESDNLQSMPTSVAIYESDYRTPLGEAPVITQRRGGDLHFTHYPYEVLNDALAGDLMSPLAPYDHPAEVQAIQSISSALYLKDRLDIPGNSVLIEKKSQTEGPVWEIYPLLPVKGWIGQLN